MRSLPSPSSAGRDGPRSGASGSSSPRSGSSSGSASTTTGPTGATARPQHDGPYWRQGSLAPHWDRLTTPTFLIGGWMDEYVDAALRMLERCGNAPRKALIGNWVHDTPDEAYPGPNVDWLHEMVRFFDHWLKGLDNGAMDEPALVAYRHEWS